MQAARPDFDMFRIAAPGCRNCLFAAKSDRLQAVDVKSTHLMTPFKPAGKKPECK